MRFIKKRNNKKRWNSNLNMKDVGKVQVLEKASTRVIFDRLVNFSEFYTSSILFNGAFTK